jgi:hypothetical protein
MTRAHRIYLCHRAFRWAAADHCAGYCSLTPASATNIMGHAGNDSTVLVEAAHELGFGDGLAAGNGPGPRREKGYRSVQGSTWRGAKQDCDEAEPAGFAARSEKVYEGLAPQANRRGVQKLVGRSAMMDTQLGIESQQAAIAAEKHRQRVEQMSRLSDGISQQERESANRRSANISATEWLGKGGVSDDSSGYSRPVASFLQLKRLASSSNASSSFGGSDAGSESAFSARSIDRKVRAGTRFTDRVQPTEDAEEAQRRLHRATNMGKLSQLLL